MAWFGPRSEEFKAKLGARLKGIKKSVPRSAEENTARSVALKGRKKSAETRAKMSLVAKHRDNSAMHTPEAHAKAGATLRKSKKSARYGPEASNWQGGITEINYSERARFQASRACQDWRHACMERDNDTCQECGYRKGEEPKRKLHVDHIKTYRDYPELRTEVSNGRTLCEDCHRKTPTYGGRTKGVSKAA